MYFSWHYYGNYVTITRIAIALGGWRSTCGFSRILSFFFVSQQRMSHMALTINNSNDRYIPKVTQVTLGFSSVVALQTAKRELHISGG